MADSVKVFVGYSHQDIHHLEELLEFLKGLENEGVEFWIDRKIRTGKLCDEVIKANIQGFGWCVCPSSLAGGVNHDGYQ